MKPTGGVGQGVEAHLRDVGRPARRELFGAHAWSAPISYFVAMRSAPDIMLKVIDGWLRNSLDSAQVGALHVVEEYGQV
jgi:hypothetical protein